MRSGSGPRARLRTPLNELSGTEWIRFTRSWFIEDPPPRSASELRHPAKFPESLCASFIRFFTRTGMWVLDPFAGTGSTVVAALELDRSAVGFELNPVYASVARARIDALARPEGRTGTIVTADARSLLAEWKGRGWPPVQFVFTSPPYWDMLSKSRGGVDSVQRKRKRRGFDTTYSADPRDLANLHVYESFVTETTGILRSAAALLERGRYLVVVLQNLRDTNGSVRPLAWDVARALESPELRFQGERIWCQDAKPLGIWGYPVTFVPNYHHHYCLVFRRSGPGEDDGSATPLAGARSLRGRGRTPRASRAPRPGGVG